MYQKQSHKSRNKKSLKRFFERFMNYRLFLILGVLFLITGMFYLFTSSDLSIYVLNLLMKLFAASADKTSDLAGKGLITILLYFLPAGLVLIFSGLYARKYSSITLPITFIIAFYLIGIQIDLFINTFIGGCYYTNFFTASIFLLSSTILLLIIAFLHRKYVLVLLTCFYFYISVVLYAAEYTSLFNYIFTFVLVFSSIFFWFGYKMNKPNINIINFILVIGFFCLFLLRKFIANSKPEFLNEFFIFASLFYVFFYIIMILSSNSKEQPLRKWMQIAFNWSNLLFFLCSTSFIILKYYTYDYLWIIVTVLALFNLTGLFLLKKYTPTLWLNHYYYALILLIAMILPLIFQQGQIFLFISGLSIFTLIYAEWDNNRYAMWISKLFLFMSMGYYLFLWMDNYLHVLILTKQVMPEASVMKNGLIYGLIMLIILTFTKWRLSQGNYPMPKKKVNSIKYSQFVYTFQLLTIFLTLGWIVFTAFCQLSGNLIYSSIGWFISGSVFFISMIVYYSGKHSKFKKPLLYLAFLQVLLYPLFLGWNIIEEKLILSGVLNVTAYVLHYIAIILFLFLGTLTVKRIYQRNSKYHFMQQGVQLISIIYLAFLLITEYDNLTLLNASFEKSSNSDYNLGINLLASNQFLPYSIIIFVLSLIAIVFSIIYQKSFLKKCSVVLLTGILIKVFAYDFQTLKPVERSFVFLILGIILIGIAVLYPRIKKSIQIEVKT